MGQVLCQETQYADYTPQDDSPEHYTEHNSSISIFKHNKLIF